MTTAEALEAITATAEFELFAMSALRELEPDFYLIIHTGINAKGKTIVYPLDGFVRIPGSKPPRYAVAEVTTSDRLRTKWLAESDRDISTLSLEAGDLVKAAREAQELRGHSPDAVIRVALVTNREPDGNLIHDVDAFAIKHDLEYIIVSRGVLTNYLDNTDNGNYQREKLFGTLQTRLSWDLLQDIGSKSLDLFETELGQEPNGIWAREGYESQLILEISTRPLTFLVAESGRGKSTLALRVARAFAASGGAALWCRPEHLDSNVSLERAVLTVLKDIRPELDDRAGRAALELASRKRLLIIVDDVNRRSDATAFCERLVRRVSESERAEGDGAADECTTPVAFLVPVWAANTVGFHKAESSGDFGVVTMLPMEHRYATDLVEQIRARHPKGGTSIEATTIAHALWNDPFLLNTWARLWELNGSEASPNDVLQQYLISICEKIAREAGLLPSDIFAALKNASRYILEAKRLRPSSQELLGTLDVDGRAALRAILRDRKICREETTFGDSEVVFQHDRLREFALAAALTAVDSAALPERSVLCDPLFAEVFALVAGLLNGPDLENLVAANPLAAAIAVSEISAIAPDRKREIERLLTRWWRDLANLNSGTDQAARAFASDWWANHAAPVSATLLKGQLGMAPYLAGTRLGDAENAIRLCSVIPFSGNAKWRDDAIAEGDRRNALLFRQDLKRLFDAGFSADALRKGALGLAGFLGEPNLKNACFACWESAENKTNLFSHVVYAIAHTSQDLNADMESLLDFWAQIDDERRDDANASARYWATHEIPWMLAPRPNPGLVPWLENAVRTRPEFRLMALEIALTLFTSEAVLFIVAQFEAIELQHGADAAAMRRSIVDHHWRSGICADAVTSLKQLFLEPSLAPLRRKHALHLWSSYATADDLADLASLASTELFGDAILRLRLKLGDENVVDPLVAKLEEGALLDWWIPFCPTFWHREKVRAAFEGCLDEHIATLPSADGSAILPAHDNVDYAFVDALNHIDPADVERVLMPRWAELSHRNLYLQAALIADTEQLNRSFSEVISTVSNPNLAFEHIGLRSSDDEADRGRAVRLQALTPFLKFLNPLDLNLIALEANRQSAESWRAAHLDPLLDEQERRRVGTTDADFLQMYREHYQHSRGVEMWLRMLEDRGVSPRRGIAILRTWFVSYGDMAAFDAYQAAIRRYGDREELDQLASEAPSDQAEQVAFTRYVIYRRTGYASRPLR